MRVGVLNGAQAVRDDEGGAAREQAVERFANQQLGFRVDAGSGFVEDEESRIVRQGAGETDELALADGERGAALADGGVDALGERADKIAQPDFVDSAFDRGAIDPGRAEADVGLERAGEKEGILQDDAELLAQILNVDRANVDAVEKDLPALNIVKAQQQRDQSGLAGAGMADDGEGLAWLDAERNIAENPVFVGRLRHVAVAEPDIAKFDFAARSIEADGLCGGIDGEGLIEQLEDALGSGHGGLQDVEFFAEVLDRAEKALRVLVKAIRTPRLRPWRGRGCRRTRRSK